MNPNDAAYTITATDLRNGCSYVHAAFLKIKSEIPVVTNMESYPCLFLNIILPGIGTILAACLERTEVKNKT